MRAGTAWAVTTRGKEDAHGRSMLFLNQEATVREPKCRYGVGSC